MHFVYEAATSPQPFHARGLAICGQSFSNNLSDKIMVDSQSFFLNHETKVCNDPDLIPAAVPNRIQDNEYEAVRILYSGIRQIKMTSAGHIVIEMSPPAIVGYHQMQSPAGQTMNMTFEIDALRVDRLVQSLKNRGLVRFIYR